MDTTNQAVPEPLFGNIPLDHVFESVTNPRKRFSQAALEELAASIREHGVAQPILVRPMEGRPDDFEIVFGARRFRASQLAGALTIPAVCRTLTDRQAKVMQVIENLQREDVHPVEEAEGYDRLMREEGYTADQIAEQVGKSRSYIYSRLKFSALALEAREAFLDGRLNASTALLVARIPVPDLQVQAMHDILGDEADGEPLSVRDAQQHIRARFMLDLAKAPFDIQDGKLLKPAGSCAACPKRTGANPLLYPDITDADVCTDLDCWGRKKHANTAKLLAQAEKRGTPVFEVKDARAAAQSKGLTFQHQIFDYDRVVPDLKSPWRSVIDVLSREQLPPVAGYTKLADGTLEPMFETTAMQLALEKAGFCLSEAEYAARQEAERASASNPVRAPGAKADAVAKAEAERQERNRKAEQETKFNEELYRAILRRICDFPPYTIGLSFYRALLILLAHDLTEICIDQPSEIFQSVFPEYKLADEDDAKLAELDNASLDQCQMLLFDACIGFSLAVSAYELDNVEESPIRVALLKMAEAATLDIEKIRAEVFPPAAPPAEEAKPADPAPAKKSRKKAAAPAADEPESAAANPNPAWPFPIGAKPQEPKKRAKKSASTDSNSTADQAETAVNEEAPHA